MRIRRIQDTDTGMSMAKRSTTGSSSTGWMTNSNPGLSVQGVDRCKTCSPCVYPAFESAPGSSRTGGSGTTSGIQWAWEPVIVKSSRTGLSTAAIKSGRARWVKDWLETLPTGRYFTKGGGQAPAQRILGEKPAAFCRWVFELLGLEPGDELVDVFPGSGAVMEAFEGVRVDRFTEQLELDYR